MIRSGSRWPQVYGDRPPWHDIQLAVRGPAVGDVETMFRERWEDPAPLTRNPINVISRAHPARRPRTPGPLPAQLPDPRPGGTANVQVLRTYAYRRSGYPFAPNGERSVARAYSKVVAARRAASSTSRTSTSGLARSCTASPTSLRRNQRLHLIAVVPHHPDQDGRFSMPPNLVGRQQALDELYACRSGKGRRLRDREPRRYAGVRARQGLCH